MLNFNQEFAMSLLYEVNVDRRIGSAKRITQEILSRLTEHRPLRNVNIRLWDGTWWPDNRPRAATLVLNQPGALKEMLLPGSAAALGVAFVEGVFDLEGDAVSAFELADLFSAQGEDWFRKLELGYHLRRLPDPELREGEASERRVRLSGRQHSLNRDRVAVQFHYDLSNEFFALWLDPQMVYSCAYFFHEDESLAAAQANKLDMICRKLGLRAGDRLLDIGCGWGGLILHAVRHYGVHAEGITLSRNQCDFIEQRVAEEGLQGRLSVRLQDYRELREEGVYDVIASVGMVEHVGQAKLEGYFQQVARLLKPGGLFMNHGIGHGIVPLPETYGAFIDTFVFPDTEMAPIDVVLNAAEGAGLEVRDVESLREHYAMTLRHWVKRLEAKRTEALHLVGERVYRTWRLYLAGCAHSFEVGRLSVYQSLLFKPLLAGSSRMPLSRRRWYEPGAVVV